MYKHILIAIENSESDRAVLDHVEPLGADDGARLLLVHVADGWAARHFDELKLRESEEIREDREYLGRICEELARPRIRRRARLAMGDPATELSKVAVEKASTSLRCRRTVTVS
jgi:nucleotide-binding universal stress UspA family protein